ncbi:MAG: hypothetical protein M1820_002463 [Bogoriella megaspora]|nr:MAG: hypothetical protein M1820_002463 [Bogoriella megaspora]
MANMNPFLASIHDKLVNFYGPMPPPTEDPLRKLASRLFKSEKYSDIMVACKGHKWFAHRMVLESSSGFFEKRFKEAWTKDRVGVDSIDLDDDEEPQVDAMLEFIYTGNYSAFALVMQNDPETGEPPAKKARLAHDQEPESGTAASSSGNSEIEPDTEDIKEALHFHINMYLLGDKYACKDLCNKAVDKIVEILDHDWVFVSNTFSSCIPLIFGNTIAPGDGLRLAFTYFAGVQYYLLLHKDPDFDDVLRRYPEFTTGTLAQVLHLNGAIARRPHL